MIIYRITRSKYAGDLSGKGAEIYGGRWNNPGKPVLYTSATMSLAFLEVLVHLPYGMTPEDLVLISLSISLDPSNIYSPLELPDNWKQIPPASQTKEIGEQWLNEKKFPAMRVPSVILPVEHNILLNPLHPGYKNLEIINREPLFIDSRLK